MNPQAVLAAILFTAVFGLPLYLILFDEPCAECEHGRWQHGDNACAGSDTLGGQVRPCRCRGHRVQLKQNRR